MSFLQPLLLVGLLAGGVPLAIHLLGRRRAPRVRFAALDFVLRSNKRLARRLTLRQWLLLGVRVALVAGAALMMAKPVAVAESDLPAFGAGPQSAVLVIDDTLSMRFVGGDGESNFARARRRASELVKLLGAQAEVAVISVASPEGPLAQLTHDVRRVRAAVARLQPSYRHATLAPALAQARTMLAGASLPTRRIFIISDFADHGGEVPPAAAGSRIKLHRIEIRGDAGAGSLANLGVAQLGAEPSSAPGQRSTRITARVCNHGAKAARTAVRLAIDGRRVTEAMLTVAPRSCADKRFQHAFSRGGGHEALVSLSPDALPDDDRRYLQVDVQSDVRVLLVNGSPSPIRHKDELFYLETALHAGSEGRRIVSRSVTLAELERTRLDAYDAIALCNVAGLPTAATGALTRFVRRGGGLLVSLGDRVEPEAFNRTLADLLPQPLRGAAAAARGTPGLRVGRIDAEHPVMVAIWSGGEAVGLRSARFATTYRLRPAPADDRRVVLWFDDGSPAMLERRVGAGRVVLLATTIDRDWTDLPIRPSYLPLVRQLVRYLGRALTPSAQPSLLVGEARSLRPTGGQRQLRLVGPSGEERIWEAESLGERAAEVRAHRPGFYRVYAATAAGRQRRLPSLSFAANLDPRESDLARRARRPSSEVRTATRATRQIELWHALGLALLVLLVTESVLTRRG